MTTDHWTPVDRLPDSYRSLVAELLKSSRALLRSAAANPRLRTSAGSFYLLRSVSIDTLAYLTTSRQSVFFLFIRQPETEDVILKLRVRFDVTPSEEAAQPEAPNPHRVTVRGRLPPVFALNLSFRQMRILAEALGEGNWSNIVFLRIGLFLMAANRTSDWLQARVAWMWHAAERAEVVYQRVAAPGATPTVRFSPQPFLMLFDEIAEWARKGYSGGPRVPVLVNATGDLAVQRILQAMILAWTEARSVCSRPAPHPLFDAILPPMELRHYRAEMTLRLRPDGMLAEKENEDVFRMGMIAAAEDDVVDLVLGPPDFLLSGNLYQKLLDAMVQDFPLRRLFSDTGLQSFERDRFERFLRSAAPEAVVFRTEKNRDVDTDVFVFVGKWDGETRRVIAVGKFRVHREGRTYVVRVLDEVESMTIAYSDLPSPRPPRPSPLLPRYLLMLVTQLRNWQHALE